MLALERVVGGHGPLTASDRELEMPLAACPDAQQGAMPFWRVPMRRRDDHIVPANRGRQGAPAEHRL